MPKELSKPILVLTLIRTLILYKDVKFYLLIHWCIVERAARRGRGRW